MSVRIDIAIKVTPESETVSTLVTALSSNVTLPRGLPKAVEVPTKTCVKE